MPLLFKFVLLLEVIRSVLVRVFVVANAIERVPKLAVAVISDPTKVLTPVLSTYLPPLAPKKLPVPLTGIADAAVSAPMLATPTVPAPVPAPVVQTPNVW